MGPLTQGFAQVLPVQGPGYPGSRGKSGWATQHPAARASRPAHRPAPPPRGWGWPPALPAHPPGTGHDLHEVIGDLALFQGRSSAAGCFPGRTPPRHMDLAGAGDGEHSLLPGPVAPDGPEGIRVRVPAGDQEVGAAQRRVPSRRRWRRRSPPHRSRIPGGSQIPPPADPGEGCAHSAASGSAPGWSERYPHPDRRRHRSWWADGTRPFSTRRGITEITRMSWGSTPIFSAK